MSNTATGAMLLNESPQGRLRHNCERALLKRGWKQGQAISFNAAVQMVEDIANDVAALIQSEMRRDNLSVAAAPKMLAALKFVREQITNLEGHENCRCLVCEGIPTECDKAIEAATVAG